MCLKKGGCNMKIYKPKNITKVRIAKRAMEIVMKENKSVTYSKLRNLFLSSNTCEKLFDDDSTL